MNKTIRGNTDRWGENIGSEPKYYVTLTLNDLKRKEEKQLEDEEEEILYDNYKRWDY